MNHGRLTQLPQPNPAVGDACGDCQTGPGRVLPLALDEEDMKLISPEQLIELLPADMPTSAVALARLASSLVFRNQSRLGEALSEGWLNSEVITINGQQAYFVCWNKTFDGGLWVNVAQALGGHA